jgi:hypothetical protein
MLRALTPVLLALVLAPPALGGGTSPGFAIGGGGVADPGSAVRYVTLRADGGTVLAAVGKADGIVRSSRLLTGQWGVPVVTFGSITGGLSHDRKVLVVGDTAAQRGPLVATSRLLVVDTRTLRPSAELELRGDFAFDALSPDGSTLYLIQHVSQEDVTRYRVRAYDLRARRLLPRVIADRRQEGWTMRGYPVARATSPDGRWVYTLYRQPGNYPFVHALDTVGRSAVCGAVPESWTGNPSEQSMTGALQLDGTRLLVADRAGEAPRYVLDTRTFRVSAAPGEGGPPIAAAGVGVVAALLLVGTVLVARRRA